MTEDSFKYRRIGAGLLEPLPPLHAHMTQPWFAVHDVSGSSAVWSTSGCHVYLCHKCRNGLCLERCGLMLSTLGTVPVPLYLMRTFSYILLTASWFWHHYQWPCLVCSLCFHPQSWMMRWLWFSREFKPLCLISSGPGILSWIHCVYICRSEGIYWLMPCVTLTSISCSGQMIHQLPSRQARLFSLLGTQNSLLTVFHSSWWWKVLSNCKWVMAAL